MPSTGKRSSVEERVDDAPSYASFEKNVRVYIVPTYLAQWYGDYSLKHDRT